MMAGQNSTWYETTIGQLGEVVTGTTPPTKNPEFYGNEYPFITPTDIDLDSRIVQTDRFLSEEGRRKFERRMLPAGAVCFVCIGATIGKICMATRLSLTNQQINSVVADEPRHDSKFLYYLLRHEADRVKSVAGGAATPIVNKSTFSQVTVTVPPLPTQHKIGTILSAYDDLIENNIRRIAILEEMAQLIYREWFVHFRFPGHEQVAMVDSEFGLIPEGWEVVKLASVTDVNAASIRGDESPEQINYVNISSVSTGRIEKIEPMAFEDAPSRARRIVGHGDIIWSTVRPNRKAYCLILDPVPNMIVSTGFAVITARQVPYTYLYHALTTDEFVAYLTNNATGAAYPAVNTGDFENADVLLPAGEPMQTFHNIVVDLFDEKQNLHRRNEVLRCTRDLLLRRLISGEVDVSELEIKDLTGFGNLSGLDGGNEEWTQ